MVKKEYYPYKSDKPDKKYYVITKAGKKVYFGAAGMNDFITYCKSLTPDEANKKRQAYITRHKKNEDWENPDSAGYWSRYLLWSYKTIKESYENIKKDLKKKGYIT